jgi:hypothetical protein
MFESGSMDAFAAPAVLRYRTLKKVFVRETQVRDPAGLIVPTPGEMAEWLKAAVC